MSIVTKETKDAAKIAAFTLALYGASEVARSMLASNANAAAIAPAVASEWVCGRLGVAWSDPNAPPLDGKAIARRVGQGAALAAAVAAVAIAVAVATGAARVKAGSFGLVETFVGAIVPAFVAMRHELVAHGLALRILAQVRSPRVRVAALAASSAAYAFGGGATGFEIAAQAALGACTGLLWVTDRGAWRAVAAHAVWMWLTTVLLRGSVVEVAGRAGALAGPDGSGFTGLGAALALLAAFVAGALWLRRKRPEAAPTS